MDSQPTPDQSNQIEPARLPFDAEFYKRCDDFCVEALTAVPELAGVAIIPIWTNQPENVPAGLLRLRQQQPPYIAGLLALLKRIAAFSVDVQRDFVNQLQMFDRYAAELAERIKDRVDQLNALNQPTDEQQRNEQ
jgi:hypothetical protein